MSAVTTPAANNEIASLKASVRTASGKSEARRLRSTSMIPAVAYGKELASTMLAVAPKDVTGILRGQHGQNTVIRLETGGAEELLVMIRDFSLHPLKRTLEHVDFVQVKLDQPVDVDIPLLVSGKAAGVTMGGIVRQVFRTLPVRCLPHRIPLKIEVDITPLNLNEHIATQDLKLEEGVTVRLPKEQTLVAIVAPEKDRTADEAAAGGKPAEAAKDAKAAPAKDAKKK